MVPIQLLSVLTTLPLFTFLKGKNVICFTNLIPSMCLFKNSIVSVLILISNKMRLGKYQSYCRSFSFIFYNCHQCTFSYLILKMSFYFVSGLWNTKAEYVSMQMDWFVLHLVEKIEVLNWSYRNLELLPGVMTAVGSIQAPTDQHFPKCVPLNTCPTKSSGKANGSEKEKFGKSLPYLLLFWENHSDHQHLMF